MARGAVLQLLLLALVAAEVSWSADTGTGGAPLRFRREGGVLKFKVLIFSDLHYGEDAQVDANSSAFQERLLELEAPVDLVVLNGDMSSNYAAPGFCSNAERRTDPIVRALCREWWRNRWRDYTAPLKRHGVPYALNVGNHDALTALDETSREQLAYDMTANYPLSRTQLGPPNVSRASNYFLPIFLPDPAPANNAAAGFWFLDSGAESCLGSQGWGCVLPDQVAWFREQARLRGGVPSHMFVHIPVQEALQLWNLAVLSGGGKPNANAVSGCKADEIDCQCVNTGLFASISEPDLGVRAVWHGHDHNNDFFGEWEWDRPKPHTSRGPGARGAYIGYGRKSGYGGYGGKLANQPGARVIELSLPLPLEALDRDTGTWRQGEVEWETWVRLETGTLLRGHSSPSVTASEPLARMQVVCGGVPIPLHNSTVGEVAAMHRPRSGSPDNSRLV